MMGELGIHKAGHTSSNELQQCKRLITCLVKQKRHIDQILVTISNEKQQKRQ